MDRFADGMTWRTRGRGTFNGAGVGQVQGTLSDVMNDFTALRNAPDSEGVPTPNASAANDTPWRKTA